MTLPSLSVVMPNYNHGRYLRESLGAILDQSSRPLEVIVIDDGSTDDSCEIVEDLARNDTIVRLVRNDRNFGVAACMNQGLSLASGEYVFFASADDRVLPGLFEQSLELLQRFPQAGLCSALALAMDEDGNELPGYYRMPRPANAPCFLPPDKVLSLMRRPGPWILGYTVIHPRAVLLAEGGFRPELGAFTDGFLYEVEAVKHGACFIPQPLVMVRILPTSYSRQLSRNTDLFLGFVERCAELMRNDYSSVFPPDYVLRFRRAWRFRAAVIERGNLRLAEQHYLEHLERHFPATSTADRLFLRARRLGLQVSHYAELMYFLLRFRQLNRSHLTRKLGELLSRVRR